MPTSQRLESGGTSATPERRSPVILMVDFDPLAQRGERLDSQLRVMTTPLVLLHRESLPGGGLAQAIQELSAAIVSNAPDLMILLLSDEAQASAPSIFQALLGQKCCPPILVVPSSEEPTGISRLYQLGASDYLVPPFRSAEVHPRIQRLLAYSLRQKTPVAALTSTLGLKQFVGESPALLEQVRKIPQMARCDASVLITGETGTGKEVCARAIHYLSRRADHPFVPLNCGAIPADLVENELFGHEAGAYTSAQAAQAGAIGQAEGGTLFLDEIDSLPPPAQVKLLRFLQDKEYRPLGARKASKADVRIVAASNAAMDELLLAGRMRRDLFYRLDVLRLHLPPLRQRQEDIPLLARHFLAKYVAELGAEVRDIAPNALHKLSLYGWPGNVRELEHVIQRAVVLCAGEAIQSAEIDVPVAEEPAAPPQSFGQLKARVVADFEQHYIVTALDRCHGNIAQAARASQKNRRVFFQLMDKHHIRVERLTTTPAGDPVVKVVVGVDRNVHPKIRT